MKIAVLVKGLTFMRSMGTLIYFAKQLKLDVTVFLERGKESGRSDTFDRDELSKVVGGVRVVSFAVEEDIVSALKTAGIVKVIGQDMPHHFPVLCKTRTVQTYSVSVFIDTLHYAWRVREGIEKRVLPDKIYFPCRYIENKFFNIGSFDRTEVNYATLGSPLLDHVLFVKSEPRAKSVVFIAPPPKMISWQLRRHIKHLFRYLKGHGYTIVVKDRPKTPLLSSLKVYSDEVFSSEKLLPYASLELIYSSGYHICGYSTSIFEARFLNKPTLNLGIDLSKASMPDFVDNYDLVGLYRSATCHTAEKGLINEFEALREETSNGFTENERFVKPNSQPTMTDNASIRILRDVCG